ncbi:MAG: type toxin-antitoxin system RelE/ParE family toxin [Caulobacter sp.]|nr:type toxin-antitoxin system RelE/ParE family toxin [Caulobacter sp.]
MKVRFSPEADADLLGAFEYIVADSPRAAGDIAIRILDAVATLRDTPFKGRPGRVAGTRELVVPRTPYVVMYRVQADEIGIVRIMHGRQDWPVQ